MITQLFILYIVVATLVAFTNWRLGLFLMLLAGGLQDPVRKLMPGAPAIMVLSFVPIWIAACMNLFASDSCIWNRFRQMYPRIAARTMLFMLVLVLATFVLFKHGTGVWIIGVIGLLGYVLPIAAMVVGFMFVRRELDFNKLILFYCIITSIVMIGSVLEYLQLFPGWAALGTKAMGTHWIRALSSGFIELIAGFYRSPDIMGWHAAMLVMLSLTMLIYGKFGPRWLWLLLIAWGMLCLLISGRNKMIFMPIVWSIVVAMVYIYAGRGARIIYLGLIGGVMVMAVAFSGGQLGVDEDYYLYATPTAGKVFERVERHSVDGVLATYKEFGFFGEGIGTASTGRRHSGSAALPSTWQEGGLPKLLVELGVPGLLVSILLAFTIFKALHTTLKRVPAQSTLLTLQAGLLGIVAANASSFIISHQAYGDPLIVTFTAFFLGVALSMPKLAAPHVR